jgi:hypothetical protein
MPKNDFRDVGIATEYAATYAKMVQNTMPILGECCERRTLRASGKRNVVFTSDNGGVLENLAVYWASSNCSKAAFASRRWPLARQIAADQFPIRP